MNRVCSCTSVLSSLHPAKMAQAAAMLGLISAIIQLVDFSTRPFHRLQQFAAATSDTPGSF